MSLKKCCTRWSIASSHAANIILFISDYKYTFSKIKYCPECGQSLSEVN